MTDTVREGSAADVKPVAEATPRERALADARKFVGELEKIREEDRGRLAQLRRNAADTLPGRGTSWFFGYLYSERRRRHAEIYFLVATLFDWNRRPAAAGDLGRALRAAVDGNEDAMRRRFGILLDAAFERVHDPLDEAAPWQDGGGELAFRLRQTVRLLAAREVGIDWAELLVDLCEWSRPDRRVQKKWARSFFGGPPPDGPGDETTTD